jgi:hypothetical protein
MTFTPPFEYSDLSVAWRRRSFDGNNQDRLVLLCQCGRASRRQILSAPIERAPDRQYTHGADRILD